MLAASMVAEQLETSSGSATVSSPEKRANRPWILDRPRCWPVTATVECAGSMVHRPGRGMAASPGRVSVMTPSRSPSGGTVSDRATGTEPGAATIRVAAPVSATETAKWPSASTVARPICAPVRSTSVTVADSSGQPSRPRIDPETAAVPSLAWSGPAVTRSPVTAEGHVVRDVVTGGDPQAGRHRAEATGDERVVTGEQVLEGEVALLAGAGRGEHVAGLVEQAARRLCERPLITVGPHDAADPGAADQLEVLLQRPVPEHDGDRHRL